MKKILIPIISILLLITSCSTVSNYEDVSFAPTWIVQHEDTTSTLFFLQSSVSTSEEDALKIACEQFVDFFCEELSIKENRDSYLESLLTTSSISSYNLYISKRYFQTEGTLIKGYFLFSASRVLIEQKQEENNVIIRKALSEITSLVNLSDETYRNNKDLLAFSYLVDAYIIASDSKINPSYVDKEEILARCIKLLSATEVSVYNFDEKNLNCDIEIFRNVGIIAPSILDSKLKFSYSSFNPQLQTYLETESIQLLGKDKRFQFKPKNKSILEKGVLLIEIDISEDLNKLKSKGYNEAYQILDKANNSYIVSYDKSNLFEGKTVTLSIYENDLNQVSMEPISENLLKKYFEKLGAIVEISNNKLGFEEDRIPQNSDYLAIFKNEVTDKNSESYYSVRTAGSVEVYNAKTATLLFDSGRFDCVSNADDEDSAIKIVFENFAKRSIFYIKENL